MAKKATKLEPPKCCLGYPEKQAKKIMGKRWADFDHSRLGCTMGICRKHGSVFYVSDVEGYLGL